MKDEKELSPEFELPGAPTAKQLAVSDYIAYFRFHEEKKELEAKQPKLSSPTLRRLRGRRLF